MSASVSGGLTASLAASKTTDELFASIYEQLKAAEAALKAKEEKLKVRLKKIPLGFSMLKIRVSQVQQGRLRAKKRALQKRERALQAKQEEQQALLDKRERLLDVREAAYAARMRRLTRIQREEHMKQVRPSVSLRVKFIYFLSFVQLIAEFSAHPQAVIALQRSTRAWLSRMALQRAAKIVLTAESFRDGRRRNAALVEIFQSEVEHVARLIMIVKHRTAWLEAFPQSSTRINPALFKKVRTVGAELRRLNLFIEWSCRFFMDLMRL
jgi:hypothetical protein